MSVDLAHLYREEKATLAQQEHDLLAGRKQAQGADPRVDGFIDLLGPLAARLRAKVDGKASAKGAHAGQVAVLLRADAELDAWYRHCADFVSVEAHRHVGDHVPEAAALYAAAWPEGLSHIDDPPADEIPIVRAALGVLRSADHAATVAAIGLPTAWFDKLDAALTASAAAVAALAQSRADTGTQVAEGRDAEDEFVELMVQLRQAVGGLAPRSNAAKTREGEALLRPLLDALKQKRAIAKARATAKKTPADPTPTPTPTK